MDPGELSRLGEGTRVAVEWVRGLLSRPADRCVPWASSGTPRVRWCSWVPTDRGDPGRLVSLLSEDRPYQRCHDHHDHGSAEDRVENDYEGHVVLLWLGWEGTT